MAVAGRTIDADVVLGSSSRIAAIRDAVNGASMRGLMNGIRAPVMGKRETEFTPINAGLNISILQMYVGEESDLLAQFFGVDDAWCAVIDTKGAFYYLQSIFVPGVPVVSSVTDLITTSIDMEGTNLGYGGAGAVAVTPFTFVSGDVSEAVGAVPAGAALALVVTEYTSGIASANITLAGRSQTVGAGGIWILAAQAGAQAAATVAASHALSGNEAIKGYALVGERLGL